MISWVKSLIKTSGREESQAGETLTEKESSAVEVVEEIRLASQDTAAGNQEISKDLSAWISKSSRNELSIEQIDPNTHLYDAGYTDSITAAELLVYIEQRYQVSIAEAELVGSLSTITALAEHIVSSRK